MRFFWILFFKQIQWLHCNLMSFCITHYTHYTRRCKHRDMYWKTAITSNVMLKYLQTVYVHKSEETTRKPQQSCVDNLSINDSQYWLVTPQFRFRKALHPRCINRTPFRFRCPFLPLRIRCETTLYVYSAVHGFWPVEELVELADGPTGCGEVARGGCLFDGKFSVTR